MEGISYRYKALSPRVLVVASVDDNVKEWAVYIDSVPGKNHKDEFVEVAKWGDKLPEQIAAVIFPDLDEEYKWRD